MNIFLVAHNIEISIPNQQVVDYRLNRIEDLPHAAFTMDLTIFGERRLIDWVLYSNTENIKFDKFCELAKYEEIDSKTIFSTDNQLNCFYCKPSVFTVFANQYKTQDHTFLMLAKQHIDIKWL